MNPWFFAFERLAECRVILLAFRDIQQTKSDDGQLIEQLLGNLRPWSVLKRPNMHHLPVGSTLDNIKVTLEHPQPQQPIVIGRLFVGRYAGPFMVGVEDRIHIAF